MKTYISHRRKSYYEKELYEPLRNSDLAKNHTFFFPHDKNKESVSVKEMMGNKEFDLVIAEVSEAATGQGIELGWADIFEISIVCIYKEGSDISGSLSFICNKFLMYTDAEDMIQDITGVLKQYE